MALASSHNRILFCCVWLLETQYFLKGKEREMDLEERRVDRCWGSRKRGNCDWDMIYCMRKESFKKIPKKNIVNPYCSYSELEFVFTEPHLMIHDYL